MKRSLPLHRPDDPLPAPLGEACLPFAVLSLHSHDGRSFLDDVASHHLAGDLRALGLPGDLVVAHLPPGDLEASWRELVTALAPYRTVLYERVWSADLPARLRRDLPGVTIVQVRGEHPMEGAVADHVFGPERDRVLSSMLALAGRPAAPAPRGYAPVVRPVVATPRHPGGPPSFPIVGNLGCPHGDDARANPLYEGVALPEGMGRGCSFCTTGNHYEHRSRELAVEHALVQLRYLRANAPEIDTLVLRDQSPFYYLTELVEAAAAEGLGAFSLLLESRADWFLQSEARFVRALVAAGRAGIRLCPFLVGVESFSQPELDRFNKAMDAETNARFLERLWAWRDEHAPALDLSHAAFGFILFTPWTTLDDLRANLAGVRRTRLSELRGHLLLSRARLYPDTALYYLAERDGLLAERFRSEAEDSSARYGYLPAAPWRFRDPRVARVADLGAALLARDPSGDEPAMLEALIELCAGAGDPAAVTIDDAAARLAPARATPEPARVHDALLTAVHEARSGRWASARARVRRAVDRAPDDASVRVIAGIVSFVARDHAGALLHLREATRLSPALTPRVAPMIAERAARLGWDRDREAALRAWVAAAPSDPRAHVAAARLYLSRRAWSDALPLLERASELSGAPGELAVERASVLVELGRHAEVAPLLRDARPRAPGGALAFELEAAHTLRRAGDFEGAHARLVGAHALDPSSTAAVVGLAELALWRGDHEAAHAEHAPALARRDEPAALRCLGALDLARGEIARGEARLRHALTLDGGDAETLCWLGELAIERGDHREADAQLQAAVAASGGASFAPLLLRALSTVTEVAATQPGARCAFANFQEVAATVERLVPGARATLVEGEASPCRDVLRAARAALGGNLSALSTRVVDGALELVPHAPGPRLASRRALQLMRLRGLDATRDELRAVAATYPESSLPLCHLGEAELWAGELDAARATLTRTLEISAATRWAWIGLTAVEALAGDPARALEVSDRGVAAMWGTVGPAVHVHRGEALWLCGRGEEAEVELERALSLHPHRVSARLLLALTRLALGRDDEACRDARALRDAAPGLMSDAADAARVELWRDDDALPPRGELIKVLTHARAMMRGNRSASSITYTTPGGTLRGCDVGARGDAHDGDAGALSQAERLARAALGRSDQSGARPSAR
ncbi:MAG: hypothetical protein IT374_03670 [Polyangiaceae bacterium]|nr:hypothetical protein [Polyangiaceae bacterium]